MSYTKIDTDLIEVADNDSCEIHILPCKISYDGKCPVKSYFSNSIMKTTVQLKNEEKAENFESTRSINSILFDKIL